VLKEGRVATAVTDAAIPASVTINGERALDVYVKLLRAEKVVNDGVNDDGGYDDRSEVLEPDVWERLKIAGAEARRRREFFDVIVLGRKRPRPDLHAA
jgi:hypothetical protein